MMFEKAEWIECKECHAPKFRKIFNAENVQKAKLTICGLGFFEAEINGKRITEDVLVPAWTDYEPRENRRLAFPINDTFTHRVYYMEYDVAEYLKSGENELTVVLGNGWYKQNCRNCEGDLWYGDPKLCFDLCVNDSLHITSNAEVAVSDSRVAFNNIYLGETQDFNIEEKYDKKAVCTAAPRGKIEKQTCPADRVHRVITPAKISSHGGKDIYDCGENITGWAVFEQNIGRTTVRYAEELTGGELDFESAGSENQIQTDTYVSNGKKNVCRPKFTWHGFRYFEIEGEYENLRVEVVYADVAVTSDFYCDNEIINALYDNYIRSQLTNMHCGVPSDCPHRERLGYTGDGQLTCDAAMHMLDCRELYKKWIRDIADCQDVNGGHIQHTAPFYGGGGGPGGWGCAIVAVPYFYYKNYADKEILKEYYPNMQKWCGYMDSRLENGLVVREEDGGWCLGDWGIKGGILLPEPYINTYFYIKALMYMREIAETIGEETADILRRTEELKAALSENYYDAETNSVLGGAQGAEAFYCDIGLGNREMLEQINSRYAKLGAFDTGMFGTDVLIRVLFENGFADTAAALLSSCEKNGSFGWQIKNGATTLWEYMNGEESHNHPMFGACVKYLFTELLGMKKGEIFRLEPKPSRLIGRARAKAETGGKKVCAEYRINKEMITFDIFSEIPLIFAWQEREFSVEANSHRTFCFKMP